MRRFNAESIKSLAHSADPARDIPVQDYSAHIEGVLKQAKEYAENIVPYCHHFGDLLLAIEKLSAEYHDLGKLDESNQEVLSGKKKSKSLPVQHTDAGAAKLLRDGTQTSRLAAVLVRSHHIGLPDFIEESKRQEACFRDEKIMQFVDSKLNDYIGKHLSDVHPSSVQLHAEKVLSKPGIFLRIALSCLVDADHTDTATHYREYATDERLISLRAEERLESLNQYVAILGQGDDSERNISRRSVYDACSNADVVPSLNACDSPVGTGKTTAIMANLLKAAIHKKLRRIFIILPYTNIVSQAVEIYRKALVLNGENLDDVVVAHHHKADFQDLHARQLTTLWKAPIIVTTAVQFFETMAACEPCVLRKLHRLPGSGIFIDETHASLPVKLWPQAWQWIKEYASDWGCHFVFASGSLARFWEMEEFDAEKIKLPELLPADLRNNLLIHEQRRVSFKRKEGALCLDDLCRWVRTLPGPRLLIVNTVQSAAVIADHLSNKYGRVEVEHISTALTAGDRDKTLQRVKERLEKRNDCEWTLVATSCVEAGVDLSFRTGVREASSYVSMLQIAGRVNRHQEHENSTVWIIELQYDDLLKAHPAFKESSKVLFDLMEEEISPTRCTDALLREVRGVGGFKEKICKAEQALQFPEVDKLFRVIETDTRTVLVDTNIIENLKQYKKVDWRDIQSGSVQIWANKINELRLKEMDRYQGLFEWNFSYDSFLGYMAGMVPLIKMNAFNGAII